MNRFIYSISVLSLLFFSSCSKDREEEPKGTYTNADSFYESNKEEEQEFIITSDQGDCIIAKKGTVICGSRQLLKTSSGGVVELPYSVKVVELYSLKDHVLYRFPTTSNGNPLKNDGSVRIKALKDGKETTLTATGGFTATYSVNPSREGNSAFKGTMTGDTFADWLLANEGSLLLSPGTKDSLRLASFGWFQAAQAGDKLDFTNVTFELDGKGGESLDLWLIHSTNKTVLHGKDLQIQNVPIGEEMTAIVIAFNQDNKLVLHKSAATISQNQKIKLDFKETADKDILDILSKL